MWNGIGWYGFIGPTTSTTDISLRENMKKIFLSGTTRPSAFIFGMKHHVVNLYYIGLYKINFFRTHSLNLVFKGDNSDIFR